MGKNILVGLAAILLIGAVVVGLRLFWGSGEDTWICQNGEWIKHGQPSSAMPTGPCPSATGQFQVMPTGGAGYTYDQNVFATSQDLAQKAAENSPTYKFDGSGLKLESSEALKCSNCWLFIFSFSSKQTGYGDRKDQILAQVITPHQTAVTTKDGQVKIVVTDQTFDELNQIFLK